MFRYYSTRRNLLALALATVCGSAGAADKGAAKADKAADKAAK